MDGRGRGVSVNSTPLPGVQTLQQGAEHLCSQGGTQRRTRTSTFLAALFIITPDAHGRGRATQRVVPAHNGILLSNTMPGESHSMGSERSRTQKTHTPCFSVHEVPEQAEVPSGDGSQNSLVTLGLGVNTGGTRQLAGVTGMVYILIWVVANAVCEFNLNFLIKKRKARTSELCSVQV